MQIDSILLGLVLSATFLLGAVFMIIINQKEMKRLRKEEEDHHLLRIRDSNIYWFAEFHWYPILCDIIKNQYSADTIRDKARTLQLEFLNEQKLNLNAKNLTIQDLKYKLDTLQRAFKIVQELKDAKDAETQPKPYDHSC